ncbi:hypothetical protein [Roseibacillus persicicus]|uniref:hypothetical protein n=1 Tax=Roseibacillus persicicus TaxID=454148 RepID=UPI00280DBC14|nr:hypothetical protein [Roseibacillus persicicus]MDQ8192724.1 hypothetical protein [Roseibacillus persicicus]
MRRIAEVTIILGFLVLAVVFYQRSRESTLPDEGEWHFDEFVEVRAFQINWDDEFAMTPIVDVGGLMNQSRTPEAGVLLTVEQVEKLKRAVTAEHSPHPIAMCFYPHHAFLFYDKTGDIVGQIDVCFKCSNYSGSPQGYAEYWGIDRLKALFIELGIPITNPEWLTMRSTTNPTALASRRLTGGRNVVEVLKAR